MPAQVTVYRVLIASPSDVPSERKGIAEAIHNWNSVHAIAERVMLLPVMWETDVRPQTGGRPQEFINQQIVRDCDILVGVFWTRIGTPTGKEDSGTVEEIKEFLGQGKHVMLYFSERPIEPSKLDSEQYSRLQEFKEWCKENSVYWTYRSTPQLTASLGNHLTGTIRGFRNKQYVAGQRASQALPPEQQTDSSGQKTSGVSAQAKYLRDAAETEFIRQNAGMSPLDSGLMRRDLGEKACITLTGLGKFSTDEQEIHIPFTIRNEGRHPARDVILNVDNADQSIFSTSPIQVVEQNGGEDRFSLRVPRLPPALRGEQEFWTFVLTATFQDGRDEDKAKFVFHMEGADPEFRIYEDESKAEVSTLCRYVRPA